MNKMETSDVLWAALKYHYEENLVGLFPYVENGHFQNPMRKDEKVLPGLYENNNIHPCFVVVNGTSFVKEVAEQRLIRKKEIEYQQVSTKEDLVEYMHENSLRDGAHILENYSRIGRLGIVENRISEGIDLSDVYPSNFLSESKNSDVSLDECGGRTQAAGAISQRFTHLPVHVCFIKTTAVNETATGTIAYLGPQGLEEEIIFRYEPKLAGRCYFDGQGNMKRYNFLDEDSAIVGVHRKYSKVNGEFVVESEAYIGMENGQFVEQPMLQNYTSIDESLSFKRATMDFGSAAEGLEMVLAGEARVLPGG